MDVLVERIPYVATGSSVSGYLARPEGAGPFPAVVVIHEVGGLTESIRAIARRFAAEGYVALAVNLYARRPHALCILRIVIGATVRPLDHAGISDLRLALTYLAARPEVDAGRLGAIGFCMGGGFAIAWACRDSRLQAIAPFYGTNPRPLAAVARSCPVVGSYPQQDFTAWQGRVLAQALERYGVPHDIREYAGARHSFFDERTGNHDPAASRDAWRRVLAFFAEHMAPPTPRPRSPPFLGEMGSSETTSGLVHYPDCDRRAVSWERRRLAGRSQEGLMHEPRNNIMGHGVVRGGML